MKWVGLHFILSQSAHFHACIILVVIIDAISNVVTRFSCLPADRNQLQRILIGTINAVIMP